jgi:hypothetical protein
VTAPDFDKLHRAFAAAIVACLDEMIRTGEVDGWLADLKSCAMDGIDLIEMVRRMDTPDGWVP